MKIEEEEGKEAQIGIRRKRKGKGNKNNEEGGDEEKYPYRDICIDDLMQRTVHVSAV